MSKRKKKERIKHGRGFQKFDVCKLGVALSLCTFFLKSKGYFSNIMLYAFNYIQCNVNSCNPNQFIFVTYLSEHD